MQKRENFLNDEHVRKNLPLRSTANLVPRRHMTGIDGQAIDGDDNADDTEKFVDAFLKTESKSKCWNCDEFGHHWQDCIQIRTIFCYGCGLKNVYKPNCAKCVHSKFQ